MPESEREHRKGEQAGGRNAKGENFLSGIQSRPTFPKERWRQLSLIYGWIYRRGSGAVCKTVVFDSDGSTPSPPTTLQKEI